MRILVDGGYLCWTYGVMPGFGSWMEIVKSYYDSFILMDHPLLERRRIQPSYKERRSAKLIDPEFRRKREKVDLFKGSLTDDPRLTVLSVEGCEADDLVGYYAMVDQEIPILAVDKDLVQIPGVLERMRGFKSQLLQSDVLRRYPRYTWEFLRRESCRLPFSQRAFFIQTLFGDRSDSVPRMLPARAFGTFRKLSFCEEPFHAAYRVLGNPYLAALEVLLIPGPWLWKDGGLAREELLELVETGEYWSDSHNFSALATNELSIRTGLSVVGSVGNMI